MTKLTGTRNPTRKDELGTEISPLLPTQNGPKEPLGGGGGSFWGGVFNLSTTIIGAGIMALPAVMKVLGLGVGIAMIVLVAVFSEASLEILVRFSRAAKAGSYGSVMGLAFGSGGRILLQVCVLVNNVGILIVYMIVIGDVLSGTSSSGVHHAGLLERWFAPHWWNDRTFAMFVTTLLVFAPLACFKRINSLRYSSALSVGLAVVFLAITAGIATFKLISGGLAMLRWLPEIVDITSVWNLFTVVPILVTAFVCHFNVHAIDNELEDSSMIQPVVRTSLALCSVMYIAISFFGFLLFGDATLDDVLANFDVDLGIPYGSLLNDVVRVSYALHLMLVFPVIFYPLRINLDNLLFPSAIPLASDNRRFALITAGLISLIFLGASFIPSIWDAFQFTGATAVVCIGFIFPAAMALRDPWGVAMKKDKVLSSLMISLAIFSNVVAIYSDVYALIRKNKQPRA
ncbi:Amino acid transporter AVT6A-like protein [Drosera capensis]